MRRRRDRYAGASIPRRSRTCPQAPASDADDTIAASAPIRPPYIAEDRKGSDVAVPAGLAERPFCPDRSLQAGKPDICQTDDRFRSGSGHDWMTVGTAVLRHSPIIN